MLQNAAEAHAENAADHLHFIHLGERTRRGGRRYLRAAYATVTVQADAARQLANAAAESKPEYRDQMALLR